MTTLGLKNVNMLTKEQYDGVTIPAEDELYAVSGSGFGFPSDNYDDLSLGTTGTTYKAPADGYAYLVKLSSAAAQYITMTSGAHGAIVRSHASGETLRLMLPVRKGKNFKIDYSAAGTTSYFRFIYAEGE